MNDERQIEPAIGGRYSKLLPAMRIIQQIGHSPGLFPPRSDALSRAQSLVFPVFSGRLFTACGFFDSRGSEIGLEQKNSW